MNLKTKQIQQEMAMGKRSIVTSWWLILALGLGGCDYISALQGKKVSCSDPTGQTLVHDIIKEQAQKHLQAYVGDDGKRRFDLANIRASVSQLQYALQSIRTSKEDPNSSKVFCEAELALTVPTKVLDDANMSLEEMGGVDSTVEETLLRYGFKKSGNAANVYQATVLYSVQPTDDGKQVYAQVDNAEDLAEGVSDVLHASMSKLMVLEAKNKEQKAQAEAEAEEIRLQQEADAAIQKEILAEEARVRGIELAEEAEQKARLKQVQEENKLYKQQLNRIWSGLDADIQAQIEGAQKAWVDEKAAACKKESLSTYGTETELEIVRLQCDSKWVQKRVREYQAAF
ncbi:hypothetical protein [Vitreoscilla stercoraria]|uniref:Lysozyme inhibitor LprI N-terminal domain-containing protein n=1 Tax=Vitreoscilla stercoraria TaxID=61 RepID=A0ABY4E7Z6_VITST|nr:hypothetical protein [Vitreoscilla stercoraria]UOO91876.1 hypothetical protein LVJ81_09555 [Vitreoscilla stercoraria]